MQSSQTALGMIETIGWTAAVRAADRMVKHAYVDVVGMEKTGGGHVTVFVRGDVASVQAAVEVGAEEAAGAGELVAAHVIAKPAGGLPRPASTRGAGNEG